VRSMAIEMSSKPRMGGGAVNALPRSEPAAHSCFFPPLRNQKAPVPFMRGRVGTSEPLIFGASMIRTSQTTLQTTAFAAALLVAPLMAFAQSNPTGNLGSNGSATATPPTANAPVSGLQAGDATAVPPPPSGAAQNPRVPGATGQTVVPGTNSTVGGDRPATGAAKTGGAATSDGSGK
jgi:hypothetical protein